MALFILCVIADTRGDQNNDVDFALHIQPIFAEHCLKCHGAEKQKGGFRLDNRDQAMRGGESGPAIIPGNSADGLLVRYISGLDAEKIMPPKGERLSPHQIALIRRWIDAKAIWPTSTNRPAQILSNHWAFTPPKKSIPPSVLRVNHPVDQFVRARLASAKLQPSPQAERTTLIRRLTLDVLGLLPTAAETAQFLSDRTPDAYEKLVDRLLASPHFGERWGRHWLDLARYADSDGYQIDVPRPWSHVYRTWVINSLNRDQPFDQFTIEQLAGDLLPNHTDDQLIATGFHRNTLVNHEDGVDAEEFAVKTKVDRVSTTATTWMGLTLGCAECHSHKFDPLSHREFYQVYAFFDETEEIDVPVKILGTPADAKMVAMSLRARTNAPSTRIHLRGDYLRPGAEVQPGTPEILPPLHARAAHPDRLDLARWLVSPGHPLTSRVAVNHVWKHLFGRGLVPSEEDFGTQGDPPTHPELLDWLALQFENNGWSRKQLIRLIVTSATYRQSSVYRKDAATVDPLNQLLARQNRLHVESEIVRDLHLQAGDLLNTAIGGESIRPAFPPDLLKVGYQYLSNVTWPETTGPEKYRRGLYIQSQRTIPYPLAVTFDAADPNNVCTRRARSNNPLQALAQLNNALFQEAARGLASRLRLEAPSVSQKIQLAYNLCLNRAPSRAELRRLEAFYRQQVRLSQQAEGSNMQVHPATALAQLILNLDEFTTRE